MDTGEEERAKHAVMVADFQDKVEDARNLEKCMKKLLVDYDDILLECEEDQLKHFSLDLIRKVYYIIDRVKLLKTGQCNVNYQVLTEHDYISPDVFGSFEKNGSSMKGYLPGLKLSCCSYEGIRHFASDKKTSQKLLLDVARNDLDLMIINFLTGLETTLHVLFTRSDIHYNETLVSFKKNQHFRIVNSGARVVLVDSMMMLANERVNIFVSSACQREDILALRITPLEGCDHQGWLTTRQEKDQEVEKYVKKRTDNFVVQQKQMEANNKVLNVGSRVSTKKRKAEEFVDDFESTPMNKSASSFVRSCASLSASGFQTTCDSGGSVDSGSVVHQQWTSSSSSSTQQDRFMDNGSTPIFTASGAVKPHHVSEVENMDLSQYNVETANEKRVRLLREARREHLDNENAQTIAEHGDFFVADGDFEEKELDDSAYPLRKSTPPSKATSTIKTTSNHLDHEYSEAGDFDLQQFNVKKKADRVTEELKSQGKINAKSAVKESKVIVKAERLAEIAKAENPFGVPEVKFLPCGLRKKTKGDYAVSYTEEIEVFVQNKLYSKVAVADGSSTQSMVLQSAEDLQVINRELDETFISFLVQHTVTIVGSEIALERCIVDYVLKKQTANKLHRLEQQEISNWKDIFIKIENIISNQVRDESIAKKDLLDNALSRTLELSEQDFRKLRKEVSDDQTISGKEQTDAVMKLRDQTDARNATNKALTHQMKGLLDATLKTTNQKINNTIHYIAMKVCVYWANINNCVDIISPELLATYTTRFLKQDVLKAQLLSAESTGRLLLNAPQCEDQPVIMDDMGGALVAEESQLRAIMQKDHANELLGVIISVQAKVEDIVSLVDILWTKGPRTKLSLAVAVKAEGDEKKDKKDKKDKTQATPTKASVSSSSVTNAVGPIDLTQINDVPGTPSCVDSSGLKQTTLANTEGKLGLSSTSEKSRLLSPTSTELPAPKASPDAPSYDALMSRLRASMHSYDAVIKGVLTGLVVQNDTLCLEIDFKDKRQFMTQRFKFLLFLLTHKDRDDMDEVVKEFSENEDIYDLLNCGLYLKMDGIDGSVILGDGYCFYRAVYQLYLRHLGGYMRTSKEIKASDRKCNVKKELNSSEHAAFVSFVDQLKTLVSEDVNLSESTAGELALFKFQRDCELLPVLLQKRPGVGLDPLQWGSQSMVPLLNFNVTSLEVLPEKPASVVEIMLSVDPSCSKKATRWTRFHSSSVPVSRTKVSKSKSTLSFTDLDLVTAVPLNPIVFTPGHFTTGASLHSVTSVPLMMTDELLDLKKRMFAEAFRRIQIMEDLCPDIVERLTAYDTFVRSPKNKSLIEPNLNQFDSKLFLEHLHAKFPESLRIKGDLIDLTDAEESLDTPETAELKERLKLERSKTEILAQHNDLLRKMLSTDVSQTWSV